MSILSRLFGAKARPTMTGDQAAALRSLLEARTPPWHRVAPIVIDTIFQALAETELLDSFISASMEKQLVTSYEPLGHERPHVIRAQISQILCESGFREIVSLGKALKNKRTDEANKIGFTATNLFEPAIALSKDQIAGYIGMATIWGLFGITAKSHYYAERGSVELAEVRRQVPIIESDVIPADAYNIIETRLRALLR